MGCLEADVLVLESRERIASFQLRLFKVLSISFARRSRTTHRAHVSA